MLYFVNAYDYLILSGWEWKSQSYISHVYYWFILALKWVWTSTHGGSEWSAGVAQRQNLEVPGWLLIHHLQNQESRYLIVKSLGHHGSFWPSYERCRCDPVSHLILWIQLIFEHNVIYYSEFSSFFSIGHYVVLLLVLDLLKFSPLFLDFLPVYSVRFNEKEVNICLMNVGYLQNVCSILKTLKNHGFDVVGNRHSQQVILRSGGHRTQYAWHQSSLTSIWS